MSLQRDHDYWFFFIDSHAILSTHRVHGTSAAWCFCGSIVQWYTGSGVSLPCPSPLKLLCCRCYLNFRRVRDLHVPCYWCEMLQGMGYPPRFWKMFFLFRYSFCHTSYLHPLPFSATTQVITNHTRYTFNYPMRQLYFVCNRCWTYSRHVSTLHEPCWGCYIIESSGWEFWNTQQREVYILIFFLSSFSLFSATNQVMTNHTRNNVQNLTGKLYFVCKHCWIYLRHVSTLHEPCRGCAIMNSMGWEFWTPGRGRSAWWRHPCWMFISHFFH